MTLTFVPTYPPSPAPVTLPSSLCVPFPRPTILYPPLCVPLCTFYVPFLGDRRQEGARPPLGGPPGEPQKGTKIYHVIQKYILRGLRAFLNQRGPHFSFTTTAVSMQQIDYCSLSTRRRGVKGSDRVFRRGWGHPRRFID